MVRFTGAIPTDPFRTFARIAVFQIYQPLEEPESEYILGQEIASPTKGQIYIRVLILIRETVC